MSFARVRERGKFESSVGSQAGELVGLALEIGELVVRAARDEASLRVAAAGAPAAAACAQRRGPTTPKPLLERPDNAVASAG